MTVTSEQRPSKGAAEKSATSIRTFRVNVPDAELDELRRRIAATRWPDRETVAGDTQGVRLELIQELARYWGSDYDWRRCEAKLNGLPQFVTEIDGLDIHFIHVRSKHDNALPLIVTHGWPGSIIEQLKIIEPLTNPTAHGGTADDAFHVVIPSMPGYGFSGKPTMPGWDTQHIARAWVKLMKRLGYNRFVAQGGDWGALVTDNMAELAPPELLAMHTSLPRVVPLDIVKSVAAGAPAPEGLSAEERECYAQLQHFYQTGIAYALEMATRPQTLYGCADSPIALAAWMTDHGDGYAQPAASWTSAIMRRTVNDHTAGDLTLDDILDNITLYWVTNSGVSSGRIYWENKQNLFIGPDISVPAAVSVFPGELFTPPRSWAERRYSKLLHYNRVAAGGHYAAWEQPRLFSEELRTSFRSLRN